MANKRKGSKSEASTPSARSVSFTGGTEATTTLDVDALRQIVEILEASDVSRLTWRRGTERLFIRRGQVTTTIVQAAPGPAVTAMPIEYTNPAAMPAPRVSAAPAAAAPAAPAAAEKPGTVVTSPFVGTFYRTPAPDQPPFVEVGTVVRKGKVLCIIEAMKLMNEIESELDGKVSEILVPNGTPVEFGQPLFRIEPV
jgi:acetyl-CoA carboxylase biotin carboxyl carrier protein